MYVDDAGLVAQAKTFEKLEEIINKNLIKVQNYFKTWHLTLNPNKTTAIAFHLNNKEAEMMLNLSIDGVPIQRTSPKISRH